MRISYVVPVHNEDAVIEDTVRRLVGFLSERPGSEAILVENGSTDDSPRLVREVAGMYGTSNVSVIAAESPKGFGNAYRRGLELATGDLLVLTAADLPFGFSDIEAYESLDRPLDVTIGSKAHRDSIVEVGRLRKTMSWGFWIIRRILIGMDIKDSQGTILIKGDLAREIAPSLTSEDYLVSTEILAEAIVRGANPVELPIRYIDVRKGSKVKPVQDSVAMLKGLWRLRGRLRGKRAHPGD